MGGEGKGSEDGVGQFRAIITKVTLNYTVPHYAEKSYSSERKKSFFAQPNP